MTELSTNAWLIKITKNMTLEKFELTIQHDKTSNLPNIEEGDAFLLSDDDGNAITFARVYRVRETLKSTTFHFDIVQRLETLTPLSSFDIEPLPDNAILRRLEWDKLDDACWKIYKRSFHNLPKITGKDVHEQAYLRKLLELAVADDLLGPAMGPHEEIVGMSVRDRYLVGKLAPRNAMPENTKEFSTTGGDPSEEESNKEIDEANNRSLVPSSFGFTFCVDAEVERIKLDVEWGRYEKTESQTKVDKDEKPLRCWKRIPSGDTVTIALRAGKIEAFHIDEMAPKVKVQGTVGKPLDNGDRLVTLFLVNTQEEPAQNRDEAWVFQPKMTVHHPEGAAIFHRRPVLDENGFDTERETLEMLYRKNVEFAIGHGMSVHATTSEDPERALSVETVVMPGHEIAVTETPGLRENDRPAMQKMVRENYLDMTQLATMDTDELSTALHTLTDDYVKWIEENEAKIGTELKGHENVAKESMRRCREIHGRLEEGIATLVNDAKALEAFRFANRVMAEQRIHSIYTLKRRRGEEIDIETLRVPKNRSWRAFQLAFLMLSIPALADPLHNDRTAPLDAYADLLWFPTGGGKTEAYLGVAAFTMGIRRLQGTMGEYDATRGLAVVMRYTLRLLTIQQFQRATTLICAMEVERRKDEAKWGEEPFRIGLWVGQKVTPNTTEESHKAIEDERNGTSKSGSTPAQLTSCPWCGSEIAAGRDIVVDRDRTRTTVYCGDKRGRCDFSRTKSPELGVPIVVVDEEIYRRPPSMMIATVDKFAMMAWKGEARTLFGKASQECPRHGLLWPDAPCSGTHTKKGVLPATHVQTIEPIRPPDLIIQDEFHLISGPLGTMVGLYETAVDDLSTWEYEGKGVKPKIVASTATVRKADEQIKNVFLRSVSIFPPSGLDIEDNFFSLQRSTEQMPGRKYVGIFSPGNSRPAILIRVYVALLTASQYLAERFGPSADPYMTTVGYFNSLRELGGMKRLAEDDVQTRAYKVQMDRNTDRPHLAQRKMPVIEELTSRISSKDIPKKLEQMEKEFSIVQVDGDDDYEVKWKKGEEKAIDVVLATNMLSVGVDVDRIGLMVVNGQPKNTAEYIQATSRVGRSYPGIVYTVLTWSRPRDLSHYETFEHYHSSFYRHVEAQSVTPFSPRAMDRALTGTLVSMARLRYDKFTPNLGAGSLRSTTDPDMVSAKGAIADRAGKVKDVRTEKLAENMLQERIDEWVKEASRPARKLGYDTRSKQGDVAALLRKPGAEPWSLFTVPMSMREVEPGVRLVMEERTLSSGPDWKARPKGENDGE